MTIWCRVEAWAARPEMAALLQDATDEGRTGWEAANIAIDLDFFAKLDAEGALLCVVAYDGQAVIGLQMTAIGPHPLMREVVCAHHITIYLVPASRGHGHGRTLLAFTEAVLAEHGVQYMYLGRTAHSQADAFFVAHGFVMSDVVYSKVLR